MLSSFSVSCFLIVLILEKSLATHPNAGLNVFQLAEAHNYPIEQHDIITEDNYILGVQRIPHGRNPQPENPGPSERPVVLMMHGLLACSADWINSGPNQSLAYLLADRGFDVWLGNARGNAESRRHATFNPDTDKSNFWSFSFHEIGFYDVPAMIDYILNITGKKQLQYVGFSQGTATFFVMASTRPEYNSKIKLATLLAPAAVLNNLKNRYLRELAKHEELLFELATSKGIYEILPRSDVTYQLGLKFCNDGNVTQVFCKILLSEISGYDWPQLDGNFIPVITSNTPAGCNLKQWIHFFQVSNKSSGFRQFDYHSEEKNLEMYNQTTPPSYDLTKITAPVSVYYAENDLLVSNVDAEETLRQLSSPKKFSKNIPEFTHLDFIWAIDVVKFVYNDAIGHIMDAEEEGKK